MIGKKYPLSKFYIATVMHRGAGCIDVLLDTGNETYYDISEHEMLDRIHEIRFKSPLSKYVNGSYPPNQMLTKGQAKRLAKPFFDDYHNDFIAYLNSDEHKAYLESLGPDLPMPQIPVV